jgi:hypothetical protein
MIRKEAVAPFLCAVLINQWLELFSSVTGTTVHPGVWLQGMKKTGTYVKIKQETSQIRSRTATPRLGGPALLIKLSHITVSILMTQY